jgi:hypothetical protein
VEVLSASIFPMHTKVLSASIFPMHVVILFFFVSLVTSKSALVICGLHPREHVTVEFCTRWAATAPESINFLIVEHQFSSQCDRLDKFGDDLNRGWPSTHTPNRADILHVLQRQKYDAVLNIHSGAEAVVIPYDDGSVLEDEARKKLTDLGTFLFPWLPIGTCAELLNYTASGTLTDFAYKNLHVPFVLTVEIYSNAAADTCWSFFNPPDLSCVEKYDSALERLIEWTRKE